MPAHYILSPRQGLAAVPADVADVEKVPWRETHMEAAIMLNPALIGVEGQVPLCLGGGTTSHNVDLMFVDELGRLTIVEIKRVIAGVEALAQLLGYGLHWGLLPEGDADRTIVSCTGAGQAEAIVETRLRQLAALVGMNDKETTRAVSKGVERLLPVWPWSDQSARSLRELATLLWGPWGLDLLGVSPRLVLVAPRFDDACLAMASELAKRQVHIQLVEAGLSQLGEEPTLSWSPLLDQGHQDRCWSVVREAWRLADVRGAFRLNAWNDSNTKLGVSFEASAAPGVRLWLNAMPDGKVTISTCTPHGWYSGTAKRDAISKALSQELEGVLDGERGGNHRCVFSVSDGPAKIADCLAKVARALEKAVVPHLPR